MKLIQILIAFFLLSSSANAVDLNKIIGAVDEATKTSGSGQKPGRIQDQVLGKFDQEIEKITSKIDKHVDKYDKKFEGYEQKLDKAEQAIDRVTGAINSFDKTQLSKYLTIAKYTAIAVAVLFAALLIMLLVVMIQLFRVSCLLKKIKS